MAVEPKALAAWLHVLRRVGEAMPRTAAEDECRPARAEIGQLRGARIKCLLGHKRVGDGMAQEQLGTRRA